MILVVPVIRTALTITTTLAGMAGREAICVELTKLLLIFAPSQILFIHIDIKLMMLKRRTDGCAEIIAEATYTLIWRTMITVIHRPRKTQEGEEKYKR